MSLRRVFWISVAALALMLAWRWDHRAIEPAPGMLVAQAPLQQAAGDSVFAHEGFALTRRAHFEVRARVLGVRRYRLGREAELSPIDLALGWGPMSDSAILDSISIRQSGRWYRLQWPTPPPIPETVIMQHSGNMHMVPASADEARTLKKLRIGQVVTISGYLVDVDADDGWRWRTSLSRDDVGGGACEVVYVESVRVDTVDGPDAG